MHRAEYGPGARGFHALSGHATLPAPEFTNRKVSKPRPIGIFLGASSYGHDRLLTPFLAPLWGMGMGMDLKISSVSSWLGLSGDQSPSRSHQGAHPESPH